MGGAYNRQRCPRPVEFLSADRSFPHPDACFLGNYNTNGTYTVANPFSRIHRVVEKSHVVLKDGSGNVSSTTTALKITTSCSSYSSLGHEVAGVRHLRENVWF